MMTQVRFTACRPGRDDNFRNGVPARSRGKWSSIVDRETRSSGISEARSIITKDDQEKGLGRLNQQVVAGRSRLKEAKRPGVKLDTDRSLGKGS